MNAWRWVAAGIFAASLGPVNAAEFKPAINAPAEGLETVEVYGDMEAETINGELKAENFPLPVLEISENLMLYVEGKGVKGWIYPFHVQANFDPGDVGPCNFKIKTDEAAPRAIGKNCKDAKK